MGLAGNILQVITLLLSLLAAGLFFYAYKEKAESYLKLGSTVLISAVASIVIASIILLILLLTSDFSIEYVALYTDLSLPVFYKISAFWAGQAGSLLFWFLLLSVFSVIELFRLKNQSLQYRAATYMVLAVSMVFFAILCIFEQNPFKMLDFIPRDGQGMNPMLQNPGMVIHPPTLFIGYVGFNIVLAHAIAALVTQDLSVTWIKLTRNWAMITWIFLTLGIVIGGWWAYVELGWGGYWAWDPVENASLMPWLTATAFMHTALIYERKGRLKAWAFILIFLTFELTIFGTFITRSGVIQSVHTFSKNPIGNYFLVFIALSSIIYLYILFRNRKVLEDKEEFKYLSREGIFFIANWLFIATTFVILFGTTLPWFSEIFTGEQSSVELSYFNRVSLPFFSALILAAGIAPLIKFKEHSPALFFKQLIIPAIVMVIVMVVFVALDYSLLASVILMGFTAFACTTILIRLIQVFRANGLAALTMRNNIIGAVIIHLGVVFMAFGINMSAFYNLQADETVAQNTILQVDRYNLHIGEAVTTRGRNYESNYVEIKIYDGDKYLSDAYPEMRLYDNRDEQYFAEVSYYSMLRGDLYFILSGFDLEKDQIRIQIIIQPFIGFIWAGCILMMFGGFYSIINFRRNKNGSVDIDD